MFMQIGHKIIRLDTVDSTNNYTANLLKKGELVHGTVILADEQTSGRGQREAIWTSKAGENMLLSVFVSPDKLSVTNQVALTHFSSICMLEILRKIGIISTIKWPNDIFVGKNKISGILIENTISGANVENSILGIGLNINQIDFEIQQATSINKEKPGFTSINEIVFMLIYELNLWWKYLNINDLETLRLKYLENLFLLNDEATFEDSDGRFVGIIRGTTKEGFLIIERSINEKVILKNYDLKEIKFIY